MWKPGQLITINKRVYRVKRTKRSLGVVICDMQCDMWLDDNPMRTVLEKKVCQNICLSTSSPMSGDCYLERVTPKHI